MNMDLEKLVEAQVKSEIKDIDIECIIDSQVRETVRSNLRKSIEDICKKKASELVEVEVKRVLCGEVDTDDGWGKKAHYNSFEELFKSEVKKRMDSSWDVKRTIEKLVSQRCDSLIKQDYNRICEKITDEITKSKLVKKS